MIIMKGNKISIYILLLCFAFMAYGNLVFYPRWQKTNTESVISWDVEGYYWYLPSIFIFKNLKNTRLSAATLSKYQASGSTDFQNGYKDAQTGNYVLKYTSGMSIMYLPAFTIAHVAAPFFHYPQDGFSPPYKLALQIWGLLFGFLGLFCLRKLLLQYYQDAIVALLLFLLVFGTNYYNYAAIDVGMSHTYLFTLYVLIILNTQAYYRSNNLKYAIIVGLLIGLATLIRPTEIIALLIPLFWGIESMQNVKSRILFLFSKKWLLPTVALCIFSVVSIQLLYWKYVTGHWVEYSYQDQGFSFSHPHAFVYSWSNKAGWLRYTPMMLFPFIGLLLYWKYGKNKIAVFCFFILNYYIVSAWNIWDYGGFSGRAMIQSYPILLFPFGALIEYISKQKILRWAFIPFFLLFLYLNIWWTYQAHAEDGLVDAQCTTKEYYWKIVGRWSVPEEFKKLKDTDELIEFEPSSKKLIYQNDLSDSSQYCVSKEKNNSGIISIPYQKTRVQWIRAAADFHCVLKEWDVWQMHQFIVRFYNKEAIVKERFFRIHRFLENGQTRNLYWDIKTPKESFDRIAICLYSVSSPQQSCFSNLKVWEIKQ